MPKLTNLQYAQQALRYVKRACVIGSSTNSQDMEKTGSSTSQQDSPWSEVCVNQLDSAFAQAIEFQTKKMCL